MTTRAKRRKQRHADLLRRGHKITLDPVASRHLDAMTDHDRKAFEDHPDLAAFVRPPFPCELPAVEVSRTKSPHVRLRKFFFRSIRRTGGKPC
ncbi:hypothetical protein ABZN20_12140 [Methylococcus sp. ANG]|uniref:hypothetical protein n=1 Tax=Methylococcus sp. ANG TaxID=3231903 RepID=UPI00345AFA09